jgi:hypothetical protein
MVLSLLYHSPLFKAVSLAGVITSIEEWNTVGQLVRLDFFFQDIAYELERPVLVRICHYLSQSDNFIFVKRDCHSLHALTTLEERYYEQNGVVDTDTYEDNPHDFSQVLLHLLYPLYVLAHLRDTDGQCHGEYHYGQTCPKPVDRWQTNARSCFYCHRHQKPEEQDGAVRAESEREDEAQQERS